MTCTGLASHLTVLIFLHLVASCYKEKDKPPFRWITWNKSRLFMETKILKLLGKKVKNPLDLDKLFFFLHDYGSLHGPFI